MMQFIVAVVTGWLAVLGIGVEASLPYLLRKIPGKVLRNTTLPPSVPSSHERSLDLQSGMRPHYWLGYALLALILAHTSFVMGPAMGRSDSLGIWAATVALCLVFLQIGLGLILKSGAANQRQVRSWHFWSMMCLIGSVLTHVLRNS
jgi:hypothetical protein